MLEISQNDFIQIVKSYFNNSEIKNIMEIGSLNGNDSFLYKKEFPNANIYCIEGLEENYERYLKGLTNIIPIHSIV